MSFWGESFSFNGRSCEEFGLMIYDFNNVSQGDSKFAEQSLQEDRIPGSYRTLFYDTKYDKPLEFKLVFGAGEYEANEQEPIDRYEMQTIASWLTDQREYGWLSIDQPDMEGIRYRCIITDLETIEFSGNKWAFQCTVHCDSPYGYMLPRTYSFNVDGTSEIAIRSRSSMNEPYLPTVKINLEDFEHKTFSATLPRGRQRGDADGDGFVTDADVQLVENIVKGISPTPEAGSEDFKACNVEQTGTITDLDAYDIHLASVGHYKLGHLGEITRNWTKNPQYKTEEAQYYFDIPIEDVTTQCSASVSGDYWVESLLVSAECLSGAVRVFVKRCPTEEENVQLTISYRLPQSITIVNESDNNRTFTLDNLPSGCGTIAVDGERGILSCDSGVNLYNCTNFKWPRLVRGNNKLKLTGHGTVEFTCQYPVNVGG